jgi:hypothetical protein
MNLLARCARELESLAEGVNGPLTVDRVVSWARENRGSAVYEYLDRHGAFDPRRAQEVLQRLLARRLLRRVTVVWARPAPAGPVRVRAFQSLWPDRQNGGGYRLSSAVMGAAPLRLAMLQTALMELRGIRRRYEFLQELAAVWAAIDGSDPDAA